MITVSVEDQCCLRSLYNEILLPRFHNNVLHLAPLSPLCFRAVISRNILHKASQLYMNS